MRTKTIKLAGQLSQSDAEKVLHALNEVWGIREAEFRLASREAVFSYDDKAASSQDFEKAIIDLGYEVNQEQQYTRDEQTPLF